MFKRASRIHSGFTLVELLVVIGVIALLVAILLPALIKARAQANRAVCLSNVRQIGIGILMYCGDNSGWFPTCAEPSDGVSYTARDEDWIWWEANRDLNGSAIARYLVATNDKLRRIIRCPSDTFDGRKTALVILPGQGPYLYSYSMNYALGENALGGPDQSRSKIGQWRSPSTKIMVTEAHGDFCAASWKSGTPLGRLHGVGPSPYAPNIMGIKDGLIGLNASTVFIDGHAEGVDTPWACTLYQIQPEAQ